MEEPWTDQAGETGGACRLPLVLAPLADFTDAAFRLLCSGAGADKTYTEMVSAAALAHGHAATRFLLETLPGEERVGCQIFGATAHDVAFAAREIEAVAGRFCELNLNAGCPMAKVTRSGAGAELVKSPARIHELLVAMREQTSLPVTLKTRLGPNPANTTIFEILDAAERAGAAEITVHARYTSQMHGGETHLDTLAEVVQRAHIPVVGNGSVRDKASAEAMAQTGVAGLMVGRAALARPDIFSFLKGAEGVLPPLESPQAWARRHLDSLLALHGQLAARFPGARVASRDAFAALKARTHLFRYFAGRPGAAALRARFNTVKSLADIETLLREAQI